MTPAVIIASFFSGLMTAMGFGGGAVLIIYLTNFLATEQKEAQGINLVFFLLTGIFAAVKNYRKGLVDSKSALSFLPFAVAGLITGFILLNFIPTYMLKKIFGGVLLLLGLRTLFEKKK